MKSKFFWETIFVLILGIHSTQVIAVPSNLEKNPPDFKSFTDWCKQRLTLEQETRHTVEVLLQTTGTQDCAQANQKLINLTTLDL
ncbi:MAG: leucine-rich repeat domain-containing protein, partial [Nostoc sp. TH1S01]|nr:leucine-rich repeat domain-containing protein [Nostoc sp. TH1S01]